MQRSVRGLFVTFGLVALVATTGVPPAGAMPPTRPLPLPDDALVAEGTGRLEAGDAEGAVAIFKRAEQLAPTDPRPRYLRGQALAKSDPEAAIAAYREALKLDGKLAAVRAELGALLSDRRRLDEAAAELKAAVQVDPTLADAWGNLARLEARRGNAEESFAAFAKAEKLADKDVDLRVDHAMALRKAGRHDDAVRLAREAVSLDAKSAAAQQALGFALQSAGKLDEAVAAFSAATKIAPGDASAFWALGVAERDRKHAAPAVAALRRAAEIKPAPSILEDLAMALLADGKEAEALETVRAASAKSPRSLGLRLALARVLAAARKCPDATAAIEGLPPDDAAVRSASETIRERCAAPAAKPGKGSKNGPARKGKR